MSFFPFLDWVVLLLLLLNCINCLYALEIKLLLVTSFANIFSHSVDCLHLFMVSFAVQKLVSLIKSHLCIFVLETEKRLKSVPEEAHENFC